MHSKQFIFAGSEQVHPHLANQWHLIGIWKAGGMPLQIKEIKESNAKIIAYGEKLSHGRLRFVGRNAIGISTAMTRLIYFQNYETRGDLRGKKVNSCIEIFSGFKNEKGCFW